MHRRYFEHLYAEISVAVGERLSRYDLWLQVWNAGGDPEDLSRGQVELFVEDGLEAVLQEVHAQLSPRARRRLEFELVFFDPSVPTPEEWAARAGERREGTRGIQ